jgi:hypothetical protein
VGIVALAEAMTQVLKVRVEDDGQWTTEIDAVLQQLSIAEEEISAAGEKLKAARPEIESIFSS